MERSQTGAPERGENLIYSVVILSTAARDVRSLPSQVASRICAKFDLLETNPRPVGSIKLKAGKGMMRLRVGDWRILYSVDDFKREVLIHRIVHRGEAYNN